MQNFMWRKIEPKSTFVEKKWQLSGLVAIALVYQNQTILNDAHRFQKRDFRSSSVNPICWRYTPFSVLDLCCIETFITGICTDMYYIRFQRIPWITDMGNIFALKKTFTIFAFVILFNYSQWLSLRICWDVGIGCKYALEVSWPKMSHYKCW